MRRIPLEEAAFKVCEQSSVPPLIFQLPPAKGRKQLEDQQNSPVNMYPANIQCEQIQINGGEEITTYFVTPKENTLSLIHIYIVPYAGIIQIFLNGDGENFIGIGILFCSEVNVIIQHKHGTHY